jgi:hypothetical protein
MFDCVIIFPSIGELNEKCEDIPCRKCLVRAGCYDEVELKDDMAAIRISKRCADFDRWVA